MISHSVGKLLVIGNYIFHIDSQMATFTIFITKQNLLSVPSPSSIELGFSASVLSLGDIPASPCSQPVVFLAFVL